MKDIPIHLSVTIEQNSLINGPTSRPSLRACIAFWAIPIFNRTPLWMTINGVQDLNASPGRLEGILNRSLSRGDGTKHKLVQGDIYKSVPGRGRSVGGWRHNKCYVAILSRGGGGGGGGLNNGGVVGGGMHSPVVRWLTCTLHPWQTKHESQLNSDSQLYTVVSQLHAILLTAFMLDYVSFLLSGSINQSTCSSLPRLLFAIHIGHRCQ